MRPERLTLALRPRGNMEAIDLGFALTRAHAREIWRAWFLVVVPVLATLALLEHVLPAGWGFTGMLVWWAKPFCDAVVLLVLSRAVFGERLATRELLAELRRAAGTIAGSLSWRRLSLSRSFLLPAYLLEGLRGSARRARVDLLLTETRNSSQVATVGCGWAELSALAGLVSLAIWLAPELYRERLLDAFGTGSGHLETACLQTAYIVAISIAEPFYVAAGFALYLNRRTQLEGWDIEVALRRIATRTPPGTLAAQEDAP